MIVIASLAQADLAISPFVMSAIIGRFHVAENVGVLVMSLQMGAFALAAFGCSAGLDRLRLDHMGRLAAALVLVSQVTSIIAPSLPVMMAARTCVGVGEGLGVGLAYTYLSQQKEFARLLFVQGLGASVGGMVIALTVPAAIAVVGAWGVYAPAVAAAALGLVPAAMVLPSIRLAQSHRAMATPKAKGGASLNAALAALFAAMISAGSNLLWLYSAQLGLHDGLNVLQISMVNSSVAVICLICPCLALFTVKRFREFWPLLGLCVGMAVFGWIFATTHSALIFILSSYGNNISFVWAAVLIRMTAAASDSSGRSTAAVGGGDSAGWVVGPLVAGVVGAFWPGYFGVGLVAVLCFVVAGVALWLRREIELGSQVGTGLVPLELVNVETPQTAGVGPSNSVRG
jgi:MFS family permease